MDNKIKHLEMIQSIINRMATNSFTLKGWAVTLIAGILVLAEKDTNKMYLLVAYIPIISFWGLDAYYLSQEKLYRALYDKVRLEDKPIDFSLKASKEEFGNNANKFKACFLSKTELHFYLPLALVPAGIMLLTHFF